MAKSIQRPSKLTRQFVFSRGGRHIKGSSTGAYTIEGSKVTITYDEPTNFPPTVLGREVSVSGALTTLKSMPVLSQGEEHRRIHGSS
jgi:hypothetical protein